MDLQAVYATYDEMHADRIRQLLESQGISCLVRSMRVGGYEGIRLGPLGEIRILVPGPYARKAQRVIRQAIVDGALPNLGAPVEAGDEGHSSP